MTKIEAIKLLTADELGDVIREMIEDSKVGRKWRENSALEAWFPLSAEELAKLKVRNAKLTEALKLVLLFHDGEPWSFEKQARWYNGLNALNIDCNDYTTKNLCDAVRAALKT